MAQDTATKPHIMRMLKFTNYKLTLSCGHDYEVSRDDVERDQLFIGKSVECGKCNEREGRE